VVQYLDVHEKTYVVKILLNKFRKSYPQ